MPQDPKTSDRAVYCFFQQYAQAQSRTVLTKKKQGPELRIENRRVMELKIIKHDGASEDLTGQLKELNATNIWSTQTMQDDIFRSRHVKKKKGPNKWVSKTEIHEVKNN